MLALVQVLSKVAATTECHCPSILIEPHRNTGRGITIRAFTLFGVTPNGVRG